MTLNLRHDRQAAYKPWNPRYILYAASHAMNPQAMQAADPGKHPGGPMAGFQAWIDEAWSQWHQARSRPPPRVATAADQDAFDAWLERRHLDQLTRLVYGQKDPPRLTDVVQRVHCAGGAVLDIEPDGDPVLLLDFEALDDYRPTPESLAEDLATAIEEHHLPLQDLAAEARRLRALPEHWEERLMHALTAQGLAVYSSDTRFEAFPLDERVQFHFKRLAAPRAAPAPIGGGRRGPPGP